MFANLQLGTKLTLIFTLRDSPIQVHFQVADKV